MKKKILAILLSAATVFSCTSLSSTINAADTPHIWDGTTDYEWYGYGNDTEYHINTPEEFAAFKELVDNGGSMPGKTFYLEKDIYLNDISDYDNWGTTPPKNKWPVNTSESVFSGTFMGQGHKIYGLYQSASEILPDNIESETVFYGGMFGSLDRGRIYDVHSVKSYIKCSGFYDATIGGIAVGNDEGFIGNCSHDGKIYAVNCYDASCGGICGYVSTVYNDLLLSRCINKGSVSATNCRSYASACGITSAWFTTLYDCHNYAKITAEGVHAQAGGIEPSNGWEHEVYYYSCINSGDILAKSVDPGEDSFAYEECASGGLVGEKLRTLHAYKCYNTGNVSAITSSPDVTYKRVGALAGGSLNHWGEHLCKGDLENAGQVFYLKDSCARGFGDGDDGFIFSRDESYMKSAEFVNDLNALTSESLTSESSEIYSGNFVMVDGEFPLTEWEAVGNYELPGYFLSGDLYYKVLNDKEAAVAGMAPHSTDVKIPAEVKNGGKTYTVTTIGGSAFRFNAVKNLHIPSTIKTIEENVFLSSYIKNAYLDFTTEGWSELIENNPDSGLYFMDNVFYLLDPKPTESTEPTEPTEPDEVTEPGEVTETDEETEPDIDVTTYPEPTIYPPEFEGDINFDGEVNIADVVDMQKALVNLGRVHIYMDMNSDGKVNVFDIIILRRIVLDVYV